MRIPRVSRPVLAGLTVAVVATVAAVVGTTVASAGTVTTADATLGSTLDQLLTDSRLSGALIGLRVLDAKTGSVVYTHNSAQRLIPGSNEKLMTSAAALEVLGSGYKFHTAATYSGTKSGKTVSGNIYLHGQGDPTLTYAQFDSIAASVAKAGITKFSGSLVGDDSWFDHVPLGLDWSWQDETFADTAPISALTVAADANFDTGSVAIGSKPGTATGKAAVLTVTPANSVVTIVNKTTTGAAGSANTVTATRGHGTNTITVTGSAPLKSTTAGTALVSVLNPTQVAIGVFRDALKRHGVTVTGSTTTGTTPSGTHTIVDHASIPLSQLLTPFLKLSNNGHAELLTKAMGRAKTPASAGSWTTGLAAARSALASLGVDTAVISMGDGSGLTRRDWLTTGQVATLLSKAQARPWFTTWYAALPIAGDPDPLIGGTLANRMKGTPAAGNVHGKTGTLTAVNALSGYVTDKSGRQLVFSGIANNTLSSVSDILDSAAIAMASSGDTASGTSAKTLLRPAPAPKVVTRNGSEVECSWVPNGC